MIRDDKILCDANVFDLCESFCNDSKDFKRLPKDARRHVFTLMVNSVQSVIEDTLDPSIGVMSECREEIEFLGGRWGHDFSGLEIIADIALIESEEMP